MKLMLKTIVMSLGLFIVLPMFGDVFYRQERREAYRGPGYCRTSRCIRDRDRHFREYEMERREYKPGKEEITKKSIEEEKGLFGLGAPTGAVVEKEVKEVRRY